MKRPLRAVLVAAAVLATLVFANAALAANTASVAVSHTPMVLAGSQSTTIHVTIPQATDPMAAINPEVCLPPPDVPIGTPGRAFQGAQVLDAKFTVNGILTTPTAAGVPRWETLFTPYNPGKGTPNLVGTFETRAFVPLPIVLGLQAKYNKK